MLLSSHRLLRIRTTAQKKHQLWIGKQDKRKFHTQYFKSEIKLGIQTGGSYVQNINEKYISNFILLLLV